MGTTGRNARKVEVVDRSLPDPEVEPTISMKRTAAVLDISLSLAYEMAKDGAIPTRRFGSRIVVLTAPLVEMIRTPAA